MILTYSTSTSKNSSNVPNPPGRAINPSLWASMTAFRAARSSTRTSFPIALCPSPNEVLDLLLEEARYT
jgi:hypothetical protein